jgi:hypothetical protein
VVGTIPNVQATGVLLVQFATPHGQGPDGLARLQLLVFIAGALLMIRGSIPLVRARQWRLRAAQATGCVVDHVRMGDRKRPVESPVVEFDVGEAHVRFLGVDDGRHDRPVGSEVLVLYDPSDPKRARLGDLRTGPSWWLILGLLAVVAAVAAT